MILKLELLTQNIKRRKNPTLTQSETRGETTEDSAWFRIYLPDFPENRALPEGGALVSAVVIRQVD